MLAERPDMLEYPENNPKYRFYGNNIKRMIDAAKDYEEGDVKEALVLTIANHMKKSYLNWNRDSVDDEVIFDHLKDLSNGKINLKNSDEDLSQASDLVRGGGKKKYSKNSKKSGRKGGRKRH